MMDIELTVERLREVLAYCPDTGSFTWLVKTNRNVVVGSFAGTKSHGYYQIGIDGRIHRSHRLAWLYVHGKWPEHHIDHINGNPADNRIANLRDVPRSTNQQNQRIAHRRSSTGLLGASSHGKHFTARIQAGGEQIRLGRFSTAEEAHAAYIKAKRELHKGNTL